MCHLVVALVLCKCVMDLLSPKTSCQLIATQTQTHTFTALARVDNQSKTSAAMNQDRCRGTVQVQVMAGHGSAIWRIWADLQWEVSCSLNFWITQQKDTDKGVIFSCGTWRVQPLCMVIDQIGCIGGDGPIKYSWVSPYSSLTCKSQSPASRCCTDCLPPQYSSVRIDRRKEEVKLGYWSYDLLTVLTLYRALFKMALILYSQMYAGINATQLYTVDAIWNSKYEQKQLWFAPGRMI